MQVEDQKEESLKKENQKDALILSSLLAWKSRLQVFFCLKYEARAREVFKAVVHFLIGAGKKLRI